MFVPNKRAFRAFRENKVALVGLFMVVVLLLVAIFADLIIPYDVREQDVLARYAEPGAQHWLGTDDFGRDVFSRIVMGSRVSLFVGVVSVGIAMLTGSWLGIIAGYRGGKTDGAVSWIVDTLMAFPSLLLGLMVVSALGPGLENTIVAISLAFVPRFARVARGPTIVLKENEFILAAKAAGASQSRIIFRHILPNLVGELVVMGSLWVSTAIIIESSLSFLGLGVQPPTPSWGVMIKQGVDQILLAPWLAIYPGLAICLAVLAFNLIGDGMRDLLDPKLLK